MYLQYVYVVMAEKLDIPVGIFKNSINAQLAKETIFDKKNIECHVIKYPLRGHFNSIEDFYK